jgi:Flp pilus assembly protein TadD
MAVVFLSYDRDDAGRARHFARALEKAGHNVWWDLHVRGGTEFGKVIEAALKAADAIVVLWSANSIESAWVKDEAAAGRDTGRLVPVTIDGTAPPLGFRQYQTIDLSGWNGRGVPTALRTLLSDVQTLSKDGLRSTPPAQARPSSTARKADPKMVILSFAILAMALGGIGWYWLGREALPVVEVAAANDSSRSEAAASDLFVKLGTLAQLGKGKWQLVDAASAPSKPDLLFRVTDTGSPSSPRSSVVLLNGNDGGVLWSREFAYPAGGEADMRQQVSFTTGRVLGCMLEALANGGLRRDLLRMFLDGCAQYAEMGFSSPDTIISAMRSILAGNPQFVPAWSRLIDAETVMVDILRAYDKDATAVEKVLHGDMAAARKLDPDLPTLATAEVDLLPNMAYGEALEILANAKERAPDSAQIYGAEALALARVGRNNEAIEAARRAAELDPLSPTAQSNLIMTLARGGRIDDARQELARAGKLWAGTAVLRDTEYSFNMRYGDAKIAARQSNESGAQVYLRARADPSPANVAALLALLRDLETHPDGGDVGFAVQALGDLHRTDDIFHWLTLIPPEVEASGTDILFRPGLADARRDPRFMAVAKRLRLLDYWQSSGHWPDFCRDPKLTYDCKAEGAKLS